MGSVYKISKVAPVEAPAAKRDNFTNNSYNIIIDQLKYLICMETFLGINRINLLCQKRIVVWSSNLYVAIIASACLFIAMNVQTTGATHVIIVDAISFEYILLVLTALFSKKRKFINFFRDLNSFDEMLNINKDIDVLNETKRGICWILASVVFNSFEYILILIYTPPTTLFECARVLLYVMVLSHESEQIFFFTLLRIIYMRTVIMKAHVSKVFPVNGKGKCVAKKLNKIEALSNNVQLDIDSLHKVYELLHKCSDQLNSIMNLPMLITLFTSGLSTTLLLKILVAVLQMDQNFEASVISTLFMYVLVKCVKYTLLVIVPCYYSSITASQVATIRNTLHDAVNTMALDKYERRKVKAFFLLTKENEFAYAVYGVIRLNMTLPLSYTSLCATYLVIIIQFSKFID